MPTFEYKSAAISITVEFKGNASKFQKREALELTKTINELLKHFGQFLVGAWHSGAMSFLAFRLMIEAASLASRRLTRYLERNAAGESVVILMKEYINDSEADHELHQGPFGEYLW
jgi:hypothetical protein